MATIIRCPCCEKFSEYEEVDSGTSHDVAPGEFSFSETESGYNMYWDRCDARCPLCHRLFEFEEVFELTKYSTVNPDDFEVRDFPLEDEAVWKTLVSHSRKVRGRGY